MENARIFPFERCQKYASHQKKASNKCCSELNFVQKVDEHVSLSLLKVELGAQKTPIFEILSYRKMEKY